MIYHCPLCHGAFSIEALCQDQAGRDLLCLVAKVGPVAPALLAYLSLFRSEKRALAYDRALRLATEVLELPSGPGRLAAALAETVEALRSKREQGQAKPLKNHNYLKRVLESLPENMPATAPVCAPMVPASKVGRAMVMLEEWAGGDWLRVGIAAGLSACLAQNLRSQPATEIITKTADTWYLALAQHLTTEEVDQPRLVRAFELLLPKLEEWPAPRRLFEFLPPRPHRAKLPEPEISAEHRATNVAKVKQLIDRLS